MCIDDDDWLLFWSTTRYLTSFIIYLNLIIMLFNKFRRLLGYGDIYLSELGSLGRFSRNIRIGNLFGGNSSTNAHITHVDNRLVPMGDRSLTERR